MPTVDDALRYVESGLSIIPIFPIRDGTCACNGMCGGKSSGKHPIGARDMAPLGVYSASRDPEKIRAWWNAWPDANIGIPTGDINNGLYVQDIDHSEIALKILESFANKPNDGDYVIATTGRVGGGCHIYFRSKKSQNTQNLATPDGEKIGELRGTGSYVIAPPSQHASGASYAFVYGNLDSTILTVVPDPTLRILGLLNAIGVAVAGPKKSSVGEIGEAPVIEAIACPVPVDGAPVLNQIINGLYAQDDRSKTLFIFAREIARQSIRKSLAVSIEQIAGAVKQLDTAFYHKYTSRKDADQQYWVKAIQAFQAAEDEAKKPPSGGLSIDGSQPVKYYLYDERLGLFFLGGKNRDKEIRLANFKPELVAVTKIIGDPNEDPEYEYTLRLSIPDEEIEITLPGDAMKSDYRFRAVLVAKLPHTYLVEPDSWHRIWLAANELAERVETHEQYSRLGWIEREDGPAFILPGATGGITASGVDEDIKFHGFTKNEPARFSLYGRGVRPIETNDEEALATSAFSDLLDTAPPEVIVPLLTQVMAGPLTSLGLDDSPPLIHLYGETGQLKTSLALAVLSIFGQFYGANDMVGSSIPESWSSTVASLQHTLYTLRDVTALFDDYKPVHMKPAEAGRLVQNYADRTARSRLSSDQERRASVLPAGMLLSTGEDQWEVEESYQARTLSIPVGKTTGAAFDERSYRLHLLEDHAANGSLALIGGTYLRFLARYGLDNMRKRMVDIRKEESKRLTLEVHPRTINTVASVLTAERIVAGFIKSEFPSLYERFQQMRADSWLVTQKRLAFDSLEAKELTPLQQLLLAIHNQMEGGKVRIEERRGTDGIGAMIGDIVGFYDDDALYLTEQLTMFWYKTFITRQGERVPFTWRAVKRDGRESFGAEDKTLPELGNIRCLRIPRLRVPFMYEEEVGLDDSLNTKNR